MVLGITGGVGCGKSTVMDILENQYHAHVLIADDMGHEVMKKGETAYGRICEEFGMQILDEEGEIDRGKLASIVYGDPDRLRKLNEIVHPCVKEKIRQKLLLWQKEPLVVLETAILFETNCDELCDCVWGVLTDAEVRIPRLIQSRGYTREKAESIMEQQLSDEAYRKRCDAVVENNGDMNKLKEQIDTLLKKEGF